MLLASFTSAPRNKSASVVGAFVSRFLASGLLFADKVRANRFGLLNASLRGVNILAHPHMLSPPHDFKIFLSKLNGKTPGEVLSAADEEL